MFHSSNQLIMLFAKLLLSGFVSAIIQSNISAYNLDVDNAKVFNDPTRSENRRGSYFGFSLAFYANSRDSVLLVGAPRANTSMIFDVFEPGTVYQCPINGTCKEWVVDKSGNGWHKRYLAVNQIKDNAWIGATIAVENKTNPTVVVCGPRWKNNIVIRNRPIWFMNGICYWKVANSVKSFESEVENEFLPLSDTSQQITATNGIGVYNYGMGQLGFSMHMTSNDLRWDLALGSPGVYNWKGTPVLATKSFYSKMQMIVPSMKEERRVHSGDYFGYAITSGCYFEKEDLWFASSAPRAANMNGNVIIFDFPNYNNRILLIKKIIEGEQHGEYFGAALTSCDLNNDDKHELIVGAPQWTNEMDEGRIYVFTARHDSNFEKQTFDGEKIGGKFGSAVTCLGDIDYDGFGDIAVGAPYEEETGAIYLFNGNRNGLPKHYSQKILGSKFGQTVRGFGISISEPRDINGDKYPDIAVGAYLSEQVIVMKSKPVVTITTKLACTEVKELMKNSTYFFIDVCTSYDGIYAPKNLRILRILKVDPIYGRATLDIDKSSDNSYELPDILYRSKISCSQLKIDLKESIQNIIDPLEIFVSVILMEDPRSENQGMRTNLFCESCVVVNKFLSKTEDRIKLPFAVDCGEDNICTSDVKITLSTDLKSDNRYIIGSVPIVELTVNIYNQDEPAYQTKMYLYVPEILLASIPPECTEGSYINNTLEVICDIGNPFRNNKTLLLALDMREIKYDINFIQLWANVTTQSEDKNLLDNIYNLTVYFDIDIDIAIAGKAQEDLYSYFDKAGESQLDSLRFQHIYEVQKFGASPIEEVALIVNIPICWKHPRGDVQIVNINQTIGYKDGQQFYCTYSNYTSKTPSINSLKNFPTYLESNNSYENTLMKENPLIYLPPENRSVYINCSDVAISCKQIECKLGPFTNSLSVAKFSLTLDLQLSHFKSNMMEGKDITFYLSEGSVNIVKPYNITQKSGHKPDSTFVATTFLGSPKAQQIATWIIVLSVILGIFLLVLLVFGLIKIGFFNRKKKEELEALKAGTNKKDGITLETSSSKEVLDQE